jgi:hypothetical protein
VIHAVLIWIALSIVVSLFAGTFIFEATRGSPDVRHRYR